MTSLSEQALAASGKPAGAIRFKVKQRITFPQLKLEPGVAYPVLIKAPIFEGKPVRASSLKENTDKPADDNKAENPPHLARITSLTDGKDYEIVCPAVLVAELEDNFPDHSYVDRAFQITLLGKKAGKRYHTIDLVELEIEADGEDDGLPRHEAAPKSGKGKK